jgi:DNA-binding transcriptional ArsR family regulator
MISVLRMFSTMRIIAATLGVVTDSADLLLHPVRLRILQAFLGDRALTTSQLSAELSDIPPASLYRHVSRLVAAGVLQVVAERRVRGAIERTYVLRLAAARVNLEEIEAMSADDHRQMFRAFVAALLADFDRYLAKGKVDLVRDGVAFGIEGLWLDDAEYRDLMVDLYRVLQPRRVNGPKKGRRRRLLASVWLPADEAGASTEAVTNDAVTNNDETGLS